MSAVSRVRELLRREQLLAALRSELAATRAELAEQRAVNERMRDGMRRCVTCEYRRDAVGRRADSTTRGGGGEPGPSTG